MEKSGKNLSPFGRRCGGRKADKTNEAMRTDPFDDLADLAGAAGTGVPPP
jgi:hypothetical protein